jgi:hypothetical protein
MLVSAVGWVIRHLNLTNYLEAILLDLILAAYRNDWRNWVRSYLLVEILSHLRPMEEDLDFVLVGVLDTPFHQFLSHAPSLITFVYANDIKVCLACQICHRADQNLGFLTYTNVVGLP